MGRLIWSSLVAWIAMLPAATAAAPSASQDEQLAAIQYAMNELAPASQQCWAAAAAIRFDIDGALTAEIAIGPPTAVTLVKDTAHNPGLSRCVIQLLTAYRWAPPLHGQTIRLPFMFHAPDGQNVVDRALVPWATQGKVSVSVLLDRNNTGNDAASMFEIAIAGGGSTGLRWARRAELWYFLTAGAVTSIAGGTRAVAAGDMMYAPSDSAREVIASHGDLHAMIAIAPGGPEGAARAGALPTPEVTAWRKAPRGPSLIAAGSTVPDHAFAAASITLPAGTSVAASPTATELFYVLAGTARLLSDGAVLPVPATAAVQLPAGSTATLTAITELRAVQVVAPAAPLPRKARR